ncbi:MAG: glycerol-3-phosphate acyltransferase, partial [bacterium]|nr:glycerol-3-phosphate acyltransferase [bacterium]
IIGRLKGVDVRKHGSGNIGATNVTRVLGIKWGGLVFILDMLKGALPVYFFPGEIIFKVIYGMATILGHVLTPFLMFRGGKAVATSFGVMCVLLPYESIVAFIVFLTVFLITGVVALGSIFGSIFFVLTTFLLGRDYLYKVFSIFVLFLIIIRHLKNIVLLFRK